MTENLYASCAEVLSVCQANKDNLEALLNPETGFAPKLRQICDQQYVLLWLYKLLEAELYRLLELNEATTEASMQEVEALKMESDTWALLQALMSYVSSFRRVKCVMQHVLQATQDHPSRISTSSRPSRRQPLHATSYARAVYYACITSALRVGGC